jgi:hypothetical protein
VDPDPACHFDAEPVLPLILMRIPIQNLEKVLKQAHIPLILACRLKLMRIRIRIQHITVMQIQTQLITLMWIRILPFNLMRVHANPDPQHKA